MDEDALKAVDPDSSVIFVINHRSNIDYVLVIYMTSSSSASSYAVGEWARDLPVVDYDANSIAYLLAEPSAAQAAE